jgi:ribonuclease HI
MFNLKDGDTINLSLLKVIEDITGETELYETLFEGRHLLTNQNGVSSVLNQKLPRLFKCDEVANNYLKSQWENTVIWKDGCDTEKGVSDIWEGKTSLFVQNRKVTINSHDWTYYADIDWENETIEYYYSKRWLLDEQPKPGLVKRFSKGTNFRKPVQVEEFIRSVCEELEKMPSVHIQSIKEKEQKENNQRILDEAVAAWAAERREETVVTPELVTSGVGVKHQKTSWWRRLWNKN